MFLSYEEYCKQNFPEYYEAVFLHKNTYKSAFDLLIEHFEDNYFCPVCGEKFVLKNDTRCFGHGDYWPVVCLECKCGIKLKEFCIL